MLRTIADGGKVFNAYENKNSLKKKLQQTIPQVKKTVNKNGKGQVTEQQRIENRFIFSHLRVFMINFFVLYAFYALTPQAHKSS